MIMLTTLSIIAFAQGSWNACLKRPGKDAEKRRQNPLETRANDGHLARNPVFLGIKSDYFAKITVF